MLQLIRTELVFSMHRRSSTGVSLFSGLLDRHGLLHDSPQRNDDVPIDVKGVEVRVVTQKQLDEPVGVGAQPVEHFQHEHLVLVRAVVRV